MMPALDRPRLDPATARAVIDPQSYAEWDGLLDTFDHIRTTTPVAWVEPTEAAGEGPVHPPFWLVTRYDDVMRMSKDNATFLNNPHSVVFSLTEGIEFAKALTGGSEHMVASLVTFDAPIHMKYRKLTQEWFMPKNLRGVEDEIRGIGGENIDGAYACMKYFQSLDNDNNAEFVAAFKSMWGEDMVIGDVTQAAYLGPWLWKAAVEKAGSFDIDKVREASPGIELPTAPEGYVKVHENHHLWSKTRVGLAKPDGQYEVVYETAELVEPDPFPEGYQ